MGATATSVLSRKKKEMLFRVAFLVSCAFRTFLLLLALSQDLKTVIIVWLALKGKPVHSLRQNQVSTAIISGCSNYIISVTFP